MYTARNTPKMSRKLDKAKNNTAEIVHYVIIAYSQHCNCALSCVFAN